MLGWIFVIFSLLSLVFGTINNNMDAVGLAAMEGAKEAITLCITIGGIIMLWSGLLKIACECGLTKIIAKFLNPVINFLFPSLKQDKNIKDDIIINISSNVLGLSNAATPFGVSAMKKLSLKQKNNTASKDMIMLTVLNTTSIQLIPTTVFALRMQAGSKNPFDIIFNVWIVSLISVTAAVLLTKLFSKLFIKGE